MHWHHRTYGKMSCLPKQQMEEMIDRCKLTLDKRRNSNERENCFFFFFQAEDGIRDVAVTGVQTCALPICFLSIYGRCWPSSASTFARENWNFCGSGRGSNSPFGPI